MRVPEKKKRGKKGQKKTFKETTLMVKTYQIVKKY